MFIPTNKKIEWDSTDGAWLQEILESGRGQKMLAILANKVPVFLDGEDPNKTLVRMGEIKGSTDIIDQLVSLTVETPVESQPETKTVETYPALEDDSAWDDKQSTKLTE